MSSHVKGGMKRGYYVKGHFVAEGSEMDIELKAEFEGSKTRVKRDEKAKQDLGVLLLELPPKRWEKFDLPEILIDALLEARRITDFEGKRRQLQYIGKLMRRVDAEALQAALAQDEVEQRMEAALPKPHQIWAQRLLDEPAALQELMAEHGTQVDAQQLRSLLRQAAKLGKEVLALQNAEQPDAQAIKTAQSQAKKAQKKLADYLGQVLPEVGA